MAPPISGINRQETVAFFLLFAKVKLMNPETGKRGTCRFSDEGNAEMAARRTRIYAPKDRPIMNSRRREIVARLGFHDESLHASNSYAFQFHYFVSWN